MTESWLVVTHSPQETRQLGQTVGHALCAGAVVVLSGDLGAGKTTLTQGIAIGLGIQARVVSPTFTLVNEYDVAADAEQEPRRLVHVDSYRLGESTDGAVSEAESFGFEELIDDDLAVVVVEWGERLAPLLPDDRLHITLTQDGLDAQVRHIAISATGPTCRSILARIPT